LHNGTFLPKCSEKDENYTIPMEIFIYSLNISFNTLIAMKITTRRNQLQVNGKWKKVHIYSLKRVSNNEPFHLFHGCLNELYFDPKQWQWVDGLLLMNYTIKKRVEVA
jgi:hypothetical protein